MTCSDCGAPPTARVCGKGIPACPYIVAQRPVVSVGLPWWLGFLRTKPKKLSEKQLARIERRKRRTDAIATFIARVIVFGIYGGMAYVAYLIFRP